LTEKHGLNVRHNSMNTRLGVPQLVVELQKKYN